MFLHCTDARHDDFWVSVPGAFDVAMGAIGVLGLLYCTCRAVLLQLGKRFGIVIEHCLARPLGSYSEFYDQDSDVRYTQWGYCLFLLDGLKHLQEHDARPYTECKDFSAAFALHNSIYLGYTMPLRVLRAVAARSLDNEAGQRTMCRLFTSIEMQLYGSRQDYTNTSPKRHAQIASQLPLRSVSKLVRFALLSVQLPPTEGSSRVEEHQLNRPEI